MALPMMAFSIFTAGVTYLVAKISTGRNDPSTVAPYVPREPVPTAPKPAPVVREPPPKPIETKPPAPAPLPPKDTSPTLPTPPPPVVVAPPEPAPLPPSTKVPASPPPAPVEAAPPPPKPAPPPDPSPVLPTPPKKEWLPDGAIVDVPVGDLYKDAAPGSSSSSSTPRPSTGPTPPAGFDAVIASTLAPGVAQDIKANQFNYSREALRRFQTAAGVAADGHYGDDTWGALLYYTSAAPKALFKPNLPTPYPWGTAAAKAPAQPASVVQEPPRAAVDATPPSSAAAPVDTQSAQVGPVPPAGFNPTSAKKLAKQVSANLDSKGQAGYSRALVKQFQTAAGIDADGLYGGGTRRALIFYGIPRPAQPFFKPTATPPDYPWAAQATS